jgi:hypothetical protein
MSTSTEQLISDPETVPPWVWRSSPRTAAAGVLSITAAIEVVFAVAGYWIITAYTHVYSRLLIGMLVVPLFLLRSDESVELGAKWFSYFDKFLIKAWYMSPPVLTGNMDSLRFTLRPAFTLHSFVGGNAMWLAPIVASVLRALATLRW